MPEKEHLSATLGASSRYASGLPKAVGWVIAAALLICIFWLPYHVGFAPNLSSSYVFGYNNRVGTCFVLLGVLIASLFGGGWNPPIGDGKPLTRSTLYKAAVVTLIVSLPLYWLVSRTDGFAESTYTVDRVKLLLAGHVPYRDFEFAYGPLLLYVPASLATLFSITAQKACAIVWVLFNLLGLCELYLLLRWISFPSSRQRVVMLLLFACSLRALLCTGTHYSFVRFATAGLFAVGMQRMLSRALSEDSHALLILAVLPCSLVTLAISPETGLAFAFGMTLWLIRFGRLHQVKNLIAFVGSLITIAAAIVTAAHHGLFRSLNSFRSGGYNFPIVPAPHILLLFVAVAVTASYCGWCLRERRDEPLAALFCVSLGMLPAALGRCDPMHVWFDGIGFFIGAILLCSSRKGIARAFAPTFVLILVIVPFLIDLPSFLIGTSDIATALLVSPEGRAAHPNLSRWTMSAIYRRHSGQDLERHLHRLEEIRAASDGITPVTLELPPGTIVQAPFALYAGHTGPYHAAWIDQGYFLGILNVLNPDDVQQKIAELSQHAERPVAVPDSGLHCTFAEPAFRTELELRFAYPYHRAAVNKQDVLQPLCDYIEAHYQEQRPVSVGYKIWWPLTDQAEKAGR